MDEPSGCRRPLKSRGSWWSKLILNGLLKTSVTPNQISVGSIGFAVLAAIGFFAAGYSPSVLALVCVIIGVQGRLLCNLMDGMLAVEGGRESRAGELYNEIPDRISDIIILLAAGFSSRGSSLGDLSSVLGWIAALVSVLTAYVRVMGASIGATQLFLGPMAKPHRMALLTVICFLEIILLCIDRYINLVPYALLIIIFGGCITVYRRLERIYTFIQTRDAH